MKEITMVSVLDIRHPRNGREREQGGDELIS